MARRSILTRFGLDPIRSDMKITNPDGTPTKAFLRNILSQRSGNVTTATDIDSTIALVNALAAKQITTTAPITGGGPLGGVITPIGLADTAVTPGTYGDATNVGQFTVDAKGRITAATNVAISGGGGGGLSPFWDTAPTPPTVAGTGVTLVQGVAASSALTDVTRGIEFRITNAATSATDRNSLMQVTNPAATYTMTFLVQRNYPNVPFHTVGPFLKDNSTGRIVAYTIGVEAVNQAPRVRRLRYTNITTFSAADTTIEAGASQNPIWLRLEVQATNCVFSMSNDGVNFFTLLTESKTAWTATPDRCGFWFGTNNSEVPNSQNFQALLMSWSIV